MQPQSKNRRCLCVCVYCVNCMHDQVYKINGLLYICRVLSKLNHKRQYMYRSYLKYVRTKACTRAHLHAQAFIHACTLTYVDIKCTAHTYTQTRTHTHTHTHTHTRKHAEKGRIKKCYTDRNTESGDLQNTHMLF